MGPSVLSKFNYQQLKFFEAIFVVGENKRGDNIKKNPFKEEER